MLAPKKTKFRKAFKGRIHGNAARGNSVAFGEYALKAETAGRIDSRQIEAARKSMTRHMRRAGRIWIRCFPSVPVTSKPAEVRMGSGKGSIDRYVCRVAPGRILFEISNVPEDTAREAMRLAAAKLPISGRFVKRSSQGE
ncbi:50S ribosomal protein L16 [Holospora undulata]|uniref:Large ribosomal subunit protein uL16 n=1 Tax=Holospora undulata HU1 TaxID=1321371 RepID=A0A061JG41_9PROT|nr:50S ribosomal protein L16 [Holospora undulata]ETZ04760.1 50S ribosomal protein L16 [Holospora undulata HU1]